MYCFRLRAFRDINSLDDKGNMVINWQSSETTQIFIIADIQETAIERFTINRYHSAKLLNRDKEMEYKRPNSDILNLRHILNHLYIINLHKLDDIYEHFSHILDPLVRVNIEELDNVTHYLFRSPRENYCSLAVYDHTNTIPMVTHNLNYIILYDGENNEKVDNITFYMVYLLDKDYYNDNYLYYFTKLDNYFNKRLGSLEEYANEIQLDYKEGDDLYNLIFKKLVLDIIENEFRLH